MEYKYDSSGLYFNYFLLSMLGLWLFPMTWIYISHLLKPSEIPANECQCSQCHKKNRLLLKKHARSIRNPRITKTFIFWVLGWALFSYGVHNIFTIEHEDDTRIFDPFAVLGIPSSAEPSEIKKSYRTLSLKWHPDKVEDELREEADSKFIEISKAYRALTDEETRKNWEEYGDPDGKQSTSYGIALPTWVIDPSNKFFILSIYGAIFGIILPYLLAQWWNNSKKFTKDGVLNYSMGIYFQDLKENFNSKKILELICSSVEFQESVPWRSGRDMDAVMSLFKLVREKVYEKTGENIELPKKYNQPYCYKAFVIVYAHIFRVEIQDDLLLEDSHVILPKFAFLAVKGIMNLTSAHFWLQQSLNCLEVSRMVVQAVPFAWNHTESSELHQLPHFDSEKIKLARNKKKSVKTIVQLMDFPLVERKTFLSELGFDTQQVSDIIWVGQRIPRLVVESACFACKGESMIDPGSLITFILKLKCVSFVGEEEFGFSPVPKSTSSPTSPKDEKARIKLDGDANEDDDDENGGNNRSSKLTKLLSGELFQNPNKPAYCPYFPAIKKPVFYMFLCNPRNNRMIGPPTVINDLTPNSNETKTVKFQFQSPPQPGTFSFSCIVQCDAFAIGISKEVKLVVEVAKKEQESEREKEARNAWKDLEDEEAMEKDGLMGAQTAMMAQQGRLSKEAEEDVATDWESTDSEEDE